MRCKLKTNDILSTTHYIIGTKIYLESSFENNNFTFKFKLIIMHYTSRGLKGLCIHFQHIYLDDFFMIVKNVFRFIF